MEDELRELREMVTLLKADNERLQQEQLSVQPGPSGPSETLEAPPSTSQLSNANAALPERYVFVPRDRKCPKFGGRSSINIEEWIEEVQACMQARYMPASDKAFFLFDHLEGEAREEIRYRPDDERNDPAKIIAVLRELYGCSQSYVSLQEAFFSRRQQEGESLLEFSLALISLLEQVKQKSPYAMPNSQVLLRDQFIEHVNDNSLRRELKQLVRGKPTLTLLDVRGEALRWEREGMLGSSRGRSHSLPSVYGIQYGVRSESHENTMRSSQESELGDIKEMLRLQQEQISKLSQSIACLQISQPTRLRSRSPHRNQIVCRRCQKTGHFARECDGERVITRFSSDSVTRPVGGQPGSSAPSGN